MTSRQIGQIRIQSDAWLIPRALEAVLQPLLEDVVVLRGSTDGAWLLQAVNIKVGLEPHPVVQIPVNTDAKFVGVPVEGGYVLRRKNVVEENTGLVPLDPGISERKFPGAPSASAAAGKFRAKDGVLDARRAIFRPPFAGEQVRGGRVPGQRECVAL